MKRNQVEVLGVDIGGVIIDRINDNTDTSFFSKNYLETTATPHSFRVLSKLAANRFGNNIHLVSKCSPSTQERTREWLAHHRFFEQTGIPPANLHFCLERHEKAPICQQLNVTHFIDDRLEVLSTLIGMVAHLYLFSPNPAEVAEFKKHLVQVTKVENWQRMERHFSRKK